MTKTWAKCHRGRKGWGATDQEMVDRIICFENRLSMRPQTNGHPLPWLYTKSADECLPVTSSPLGGTVTWRCGPIGGWQLRLPQEQKEVLSDDPQAP